MTLPLGHPEQLKLVDSMGNSGPILSGQNVTPWFLMCSISINIITVLAILMTL
jgi:hypothetical protein